MKPSAKIAKGFGGVTLVLDDGRVFTGTVMSETGNEIVLGLPNGKRMEFSPDEIDERVESEISGMPEMTKVLSAFAIRDVVAYLATKKAPKARVSLNRNAETQSE